MVSKKKLRTPLIKPRTQGGTFYTFGSALEDIGLNTNELNNKVVLSHYVLMDLPEFNSDDLKTNSDYSDNPYAGNYIFAEAFQDYVLNMETAVRNHELYDFSNSITVSERIFWKWLYPYMDLEKVEDTDYYVDKNRIAKCFGYINAGAQRSDDYSMYNETFVQVPSSFGQMRVLYKVTEDDNYFADSSYGCYDNSTGYIEYISEEEVDPSTDMLNRTGISAMGIFDENNTYFATEDKDFLTVEFDLDGLRSYYGDDTLTYDDLAMKEVENEESDERIAGILSQNFSFNSALIYYSVYDSTGKNILATNAYGLLLFNNSEVTPDGNAYAFESFIKKMSTSTSSGTAYSFRLNIKTSSVYSGDITVTDNATPAYSMSTDFNDTVKNLNTAINILKSNANLVGLISSNYNNLKNLTVQAIDKADEAYKVMTDLRNGNFAKIDASVLHADKIGIGNGMQFVESESPAGAFYDVSTGVSIISDNIIADNVTTSATDTSVLHTETVSMSSNGISIIDEENEEEFVKIDHSGLTSKDLFLLNDNTDDGNDLIQGAIDDVISCIEPKYDDENKTFSFTIVPGSISPLAGNILTTLYDEETHKLDLKGLLVLLLAKLRNS
jgi:hypothetical protein